MGDEGDRQSGAKRKRILFGRRAEEQSQWVMKVKDKLGQRGRGYYSVGEQKSSHSG